MASRIFRFLNIAETPQAADCIFVLAGRQERKVYGINLWRGGFAKELILSIGRYEWRQFYALDLPSDGGLKTLVDRTPPEDRHFFVRFRATDAEAVLVRRHRLGTLTEGRSLATQLRGEPIRSLMVVSTSIHLRRTALVFRRAFRASGMRLSFIAVPEDISSIRQADLISDPKLRSDVYTEFTKYLYYRIFL